MPLPTMQESRRSVGHSQRSSRRALSPGTSPLCPRAATACTVSAVRVSSRRRTGRALQQAGRLGIPKADRRGAVQQQRRGRQLLGAGEQRRSLNGYREVFASICIHDLHPCMIEFRSDHACMIQNSETDWMRARGQPASALAWPAGSGPCLPIAKPIGPHS